MPILTVHRTGRKKPVEVSVANPDTALKFLEAFAYSLKRDPGGWVTLTEGSTLLARYPKSEPAAMALAERRAA